MGSASETEYLLLLAHDLKLLSQSDFESSQQEVVSVKRMLTSLIRKPKTENQKPMTPRVAIAGATGAVGTEFLKLLETRNFPMQNLRLLASASSGGRAFRLKN